MIKRFSYKYFLREPKKLFTLTKLQGIWMTGILVIRIKCRHIKQEKKKVLYISATMRQELFQEDYTFHTILDVADPTVEDRKKSLTKLSTYSTLIMFTLFSIFGKKKKNETWEK